MMRPHLYPRFVPPANPHRQWPSRVLTVAPRFVSVDLRDGNQALVNPMSPQRKMDLFRLLVEVGFKEIEVGFPAASETDLEFVRELARPGVVPDDVTLQVLSQCRDDLLDATFAAVADLPRVIIHIYNSTNELQRRVVFGNSRRETIELAVAAARRCAQLREQLSGLVTFEYSPESFSDTELDFAAEICERVSEVLMPVSDMPMIVNLPATVEMAGPHVFADQVELFARSFRYRDQTVLSVHPHNDRGCAVAAAELAQLAGATRVEGTLFGNGERTGNVDVVTLALNLLTHGIDPTLDFSQLDRVRDVASAVTELPVHSRHPYAGDLVYTAFSGSHQDAIKKGLAALGRLDNGDGGYGRWAVPYLPVDPTHVGRTYEPVIRVNSQSGKAGPAWLLLTAYGIDLPRPVAVKLSRVVQREADVSGRELSSVEVFRLFQARFCPPGPWRVERLAVREEDGKAHVAGWLTDGTSGFELSSWGAGPVEALAAGVSVALDLPLNVSDFSSSALIGPAAAASTSAASAAAFALVDVSGVPAWGCGMDGSITSAAMLSVIAALNAALAAG